MNELQIYYRRRRRRLRMLQLMCIMLLYLHSISDENEDEDGYEDEEEEEHEPVSIHFVHHSPEPNAPLPQHGGFGGLRNLTNQPGSPAFSIFLILSVSLEYRSAGQSSRWSHTEGFRSLHLGRDQRRSTTFGRLACLNID